MQQQSLPLLTTERLLLRQLQPADDKAIFALRSNAQVNTFIQRPLPNDINDARYFITSINEGMAKEGWMYWAMILKSTKQLIGTVCLWHFSNNNDSRMAEIGYELHPGFSGQRINARGITNRNRLWFYYTAIENDRSLYATW